MKTLTVWKEGYNLGSQFKEDDSVIGWEDLTNEEKEDFVRALRLFAHFFERFL